MKAGSEPYPAFPGGMSSSTPSPKIPGLKWDTCAIAKSLEFLRNSSGISWSMSHPGWSRWGAWRPPQIQPGTLQRILVIPGNPQLPSGIPHFLPHIPFLRGIFSMAQGKVFPAALTLPSPPFESKAYPGPHHLRRIKVRNSSCPALIPGRRQLLLSAIHPIPPDPIPWMPWISTILC